MDTPSKITRLRRLETMKGRVRKNHDPHLSVATAHLHQAEAYNRAVLRHLNRVEDLNQRQAAALERLADAPCAPL